ncbi:hypothetical protein PXJ20_08525 [Paraburkholderia sp. A1RI_3L]|uniref:hypothetical protein n=1 Tax=Paraburkholderia TaxID=1822464 RepID=UPI00034A8A21|nr:MULTISPECIES: hypothetical protein [Paraburkholderia]WEY38098.1 hypothetical protein P2869_13725 [Paraburkholderia sp. SUR17]
MVIYDTFKISYMMIAFVCMAAILIGTLLAAMHARHQYRPNLIGALIGALLCFVLLETLPSFT